jgi:hypothetical protein
VQLIGKFNVEICPCNRAIFRKPQSIKENVNRKGERIYHIPGQRDYASINPIFHEKRWFCSTEEAEAAGWRRALR